MNTPKLKYHVRNWNEYNKALVQRGSLELWIDANHLNNWYAQAIPHKRGAPYTYSDAAIECCLLIRELYRLPLRATQGFVESIFRLAHINLSVVSYSQLSRRQSVLPLTLKHHSKGKIHAVLDGSGLKVFGEGEWKVRVHGYSRHRMWRKIHLNVDADNREIVGVELTDNHIGENRLLPFLLEQYPDGYLSIGADKGYDSYDCHEEVGKYNAVSAINIQRKSHVRERKQADKPPLVRDEIIRFIRKRGRKNWKQTVQYGLRALAENAFYRLKTLFGEKLLSRLLSTQKVEAILRCNILNQFNQLGLPDSYPVS